MAETTSIGFPNMFDVARNRVTVMKDQQSVVSRSKLLLLTDPTELYNNPDFGVGLKQYVWMYNSPNTRAMVQDRIIDQLRKHEPCVDADKTVFSPLMSGEEVNETEQNTLGMTVTLKTTFGSTEIISVDSNFTYKLAEEE